jgi:hypothetical protein
VRRPAAARVVTDHGGRGAGLILLLLAVVGLLGALVAVTGRGAFIDEAIYLVAGRTLAFRGENWGYDLWFNGSPFAFPLLAGVVQRVGGGLVAVRLVNVGFLLLAVWAVSQMGTALRLVWPASLLGAAAFGLAGTAASPPMMSPRSPPPAWPCGSCCGGRPTNGSDPGRSWAPAWPSPVRCS